MTPRLAALALAATACASTYPPVAGAAEARARVYPISLTAARNTIARALEGEWRFDVKASDERHLVARTCHELINNVCWPEDLAQEGGDLHLDDTSPLRRHYKLEVDIALDRPDGALAVRVTERALHPNGGWVQLDGPDAPAWMRRDADWQQVAIDRALAPQ